MMVFPFLVGNLYILVEIQSGLNYKNVVHSRRSDDHRLGER